MTIKIIERNKCRKNRDVIRLTVLSILIIFCCNCSVEDDTSLKLEQEYCNKIIFHRGNWMITGLEENSYTSILDALNTRCAGFECDIRELNDNSLVLYHDAFLYEVPVCQLSSEDFLKNGIKLTYLQQIANLEYKYAHKIFLYEIKNGDIQNILSITDYANYSNVIFQSFDFDVCGEINNANGQVFLLTHSVDDSLLDRIYENGFKGISVNYENVDNLESLIHKVHNMGLRVMFWTVDDLNIIKFLIEKGADYVISNFPYSLNNTKC